MNEIYGITEITISWTISSEYLKTRSLVMLGFTSKTNYIEFRDWAKICDINNSEL